MRMMRDSVVFERMNKLGIDGFEPFTWDEAYDKPVEVTFRRVRADIKCPMIYDLNITDDFKMKFNMLKYPESSANVKLSNGVVKIKAIQAKVFKALMLTQVSECAEFSEAVTFVASKYLMQAITGKEGEAIMAPPDYTIFQKFVVTAFMDKIKELTNGK